jgi:hypothetical protein
MNSDILTLKPLPDFQLDVVLHDGRHGVFDLKPFLGQPGLGALRDPAYFAKVAVLYGAATWPDGEDIAPATLAAELQLFAAA